MLRDIVDDWKNSGKNCETVTIYCPYCHQGMAAEATLDMMGNKELMGELAVETCSCKAAREETKRRQRAESVDTKVDAMFGPDSGTPIDDEILNEIKIMSIHVCNGKIKKISIQLSENTRVSISTDTNGLLDIKKEIKNISRQKI